MATDPAAERPAERTAAGPREDDRRRGATQPGSGLGRAGDRPTHRGPLGERRGLRSSHPAGPRRERVREGAAASEPAAAAEADQPPVPEMFVPTGPTVPPPSVRDPLPPDLERELAAAIGDSTVDEILGAGVADQPLSVLELESRHKARVIRIRGDDVFFSLPGQHEGVISLRQFTEPPALGAELDVVLRSFNAEEGLYELLVPGMSMHVEDWSDLVEGALVEARITGANTGGLECKVGNVRGFIPSSQIAMFRVEDYAEFLEQKLLCVVSEVNRRRKNLVLSRRAVLEREKEEARRQLRESLTVGQVMEGVVRGVRDFGAFVDLGGIDGLIHISQLSWERVDHPNQILQEGQKVRVKIEKIDEQTGKIGLSYRSLQEHPWMNIEEKFPPDTVVHGTVSRIAKFGAFVKLAPGVEGLVHISELSHSRVPSVGSVVAEGQEVDVKVLSVDVDAQRIALSLRATLPEPVQEEPRAAEPEDSPAPTREDARPKRHAPLKGGTDRNTGGEQFGLRW
ncbi:MAG: S1 RNA-binding domain-containing protein [Planctomycetes bacterium]|nr:S1 RNA-binding domain-containing protein [Planctomycetota bacterium]